MSLQLHANLALVVVDVLQSDPIVTAEHQALDRIMLRLTAARTDLGRVLYDLLLDCDLALHHITCLVNR